MGRKSEPQPKIIATFRLDPEVNEAIREKARTEAISINAAAVAVIRAGLGLATVSV